MHKTAVDATAQTIVPHELTDTDIEAYPKADRSPQAGHGILRREIDQSIAGAR